MTVGFVGAGSWGTTLAVHLASQGHDVLLWAYDPAQALRLRTERENHLYLPGIHFPDRITVVDDVNEAASAPVVVIATPTQFIRGTLARVSADLLAQAVVVSVSKGIEQGTLLRISELLHATHGVEAERFVALSGPSHAEEVAQRIPTLVVAACASLSTAERVQDLFNADHLRVYRSDDIIGVELGGAVKNVIAVCAGILDGLSFGDNTKAALMTRGLAEITRLGVALGAHAQTFSGLSGLGDLIVTCTSRHSRNRHVGEEIGRGRRLEEIVGEMKMVAEGVTTTSSAHQLAARLGVETPITNEVYRVLFEEKDPREATYALMTRQMKHEIWT
ncbi:MAG: NAD(P)H-dependent glycerol-3-phosphate dehydrogenase [Bacteroidetes bacterium]|nr:NAD(P)H-dependent glycerol-3-phosphate dehydrogenase [Bacteroidota bacterium]